VIDNLFQLGEPVEHRGIIVTPLFPRGDPVVRYLTLDEGLPQGLRITEFACEDSARSIMPRPPVLSLPLRNGSVSESSPESQSGKTLRVVRRGCVRRGGRPRGLEPDYFPDYCILAALVLLPDKAKASGWPSACTADAERKTRLLPQGGGVNSGAQARSLHTSAFKIGSDEIGKARSML
jgi:hypothetical protein